MAATTSRSLCLVTYASRCFHPERELTGSRGERATVGPDSPGRVSSLDFRDEVGRARGQDHQGPIRSLRSFKGALGPNRVARTARVELDPTMVPRDFPSINTSTRSEKRM